MRLRQFIPSLVLMARIDNALAQECAAVHLIVARGSFEAAGEGTSASFSSLIKRQIPGATSEALKYPARIPYKGSMEVGVANLKLAIAEYTRACPESKIVLVGYSQGGAVSVDTLCGGGDDPEIGEKTTGLTSEEGKNVKAAVAFGDPRFVPGISYNAGTNTLTGGVCILLTLALLLMMSQVNARKPETAQCPTWAHLIRSWCDTDDSRCASGKSMAVHTSYLKRYSEEAAKFIAEKLKTL
jgi:acetylxylan esterase